MLLSLIVLLRYFLVVFTSARNKPHARTTGNEANMYGAPFVA